jgi:RNA polymerase sigma factor (TIGR02999 family)
MTETDLKDLTTRLLRRVSAREGGAEDELYGLVYDVLHELAKKQMAGQSPDHTLQPTALVHEAWLRMSGGEGVEISDRNHFLALAARAMRSALVDYARRRDADKRGGGWGRRVLDEALNVCAEQDLNVLELDEALGRLGQQSERLSRLVELRFFGGLGIDEAAEVLEISPSTAHRDWRVARIFLRSALDPEEAR